MTEKQTRAYQLYYAGQHTNSEIARSVGVSERTIYTWARIFSWERIKNAAKAAPAVLAEKISSHLVELLDSISAREPGSRFPSYKEANTTRILVNSMDKLQKHPTLAQSMQAVRGLLHFIDKKDPVLGHQVNVQYNEFLQQQPVNGYTPFDTMYDVNPMPYIPQTEKVFHDDYLEPDYNAAILTSYSLEAALKFHEDMHNPCHEIAEVHTAELPPNKVLFLGKIVDSSLFQPDADPLHVLEENCSLLPVYPQQENSEDRSTLDSSPITVEDYEKYKPILKEPTPSDEHKVIFNGQKVQKSWLQYNLFQFCLAPSNRFFIKNEEEYKLYVNPTITCQQIHHFFRDNDVDLEHFY